MATDRRLRVALVTGRYAPREDGVADYTARLVEAVRAGTGIDVSVVSAEGADHGAQVVAPRWDLAGTRAAARRIGELRPDVVHVQYAPTAYRPGGRGRSGIGLLPALVRAPVVTTLHEYGAHHRLAPLPAAAWSLTERAGWGDRETLLLAARSREVLVTNTGHAVALRRRVRREPSVVPIGPNVRDTGLTRSGARQEVRRRWDVPAGPLLVFFGFVHPVKGVRYLLEALTGVRATGAGRDATLVVAGGFTSLALPAAEAAAFRAELASHAARVGVAGAVRWTGHVDEREVSTLLRAADLVVLPLTAGVTLKSSALLAALGHGACVVATRPPAAAERSPALDGAVVPIPQVRDAPAIAAALGLALADPGLRERTAAAGGRLAAGHRWGRIAERHAELYARVLR